MYRATVLLSAYGCSQYFSGQVQSICNQLTPEDLLVVVDDGSRNVPWGQLNNFLPKNYIFWSRLKNMGSSLSFIELLLNHEDFAGQFYLLADQDDKWMPGKLQGQIDLTPLNGMSVHGWRVSWLEDGAIGRCKFDELPIAKLSEMHYFFETSAPGMTICLSSGARSFLKSKNEMLVTAVQWIPHDRVIAALVSTHAQVACLPQVWVEYHQHGSNQIGAPYKSRLKMTYIRLLRMRYFITRLRAILNLIRDIQPKKMVHVKRRSLFPRLRINRWESMAFNVFVVLLGGLENQVREKISTR